MVLGGSIITVGVYCTVFGRASAQNGNGGFSFLYYTMPFKDESSKMCHVCILSTAEFSITELYVLHIMGAETMPYFAYLALYESSMSLCSFFNCPFGIICGQQNYRKKG